jgi:ribosomal protein L1
LEAVVRQSAEDRQSLKEEGRRSFVDLQNVKAEVRQSAVARQNVEAEVRQSVVDPRKVGLHESVLVVRRNEDQSEEAGRQNVVAVHQKTEVADHRRTQERADRKIQAAVHRKIHLPMEVARQIVDRLAPMEAFASEVHAV